jgi:hypothetical protein
MWSNFFLCTSEVATITEFIKQIATIAEFIKQIATIAEFII